MLLFYILECGNFSYHCLKARFMVFLKAKKKKKSHKSYDSSFLLTVIKFIKKKQLVNLGEQSIRSLVGFSPGCYEPWAQCTGDG